MSAQQKAQPGNRSVKKGHSHSRSKSNTTTANSTNNSGTSKPDAKYKPVSQTRGWAAVAQSGAQRKSSSTSPNPRGRSPTKEADGKRKPTKQTNAIGNKPQELAKSQESEKPIRRNNESKNDFNADEVSRYLQSSYKFYLSIANDRLNREEIRVYKPEEGSWGKIGGGKKKNGANAGLDILVKLARSL